MSLLPSLLLAHDPWEMMRPIRNWDNFGHGVTPLEIQMFSDLAGNLPACRRRECADLKKRGKAGTLSHVGKDGFQVSMDVQLFRPNEITVKTVDNTVVVEGKHEERSDEHGHISRNFVRKYYLPKGYDSNEVNSTLSSDGFLTIKAPPPLPENVAGKERVIQIQQTGPAHLHVKDNEPIEGKKGENDDTDANLNG